MSTEYKTAQLLAEKYRTKGYEVIIAPNPDLIPFDLEGYRPDLLAIKDNSKLIIEVKDKFKNLSIERFQTIAQLIAQHKGWRFILVTANDEQENDDIDAEKAYLSWDEIANQIAQFPAMTRIIGNNAALLYLWGVCEAVLRRYALEHAIPVERQPFTHLAKYLYSEGDLSIAELNMLLDVQKYRNKVAHGFKVNISEEILSNLMAFIKRTVSEQATVVS